MSRLQFSVFFFVVTMLAPMIAAATAKSEDIPGPTAALEAEEPIQRCYSAETDRVYELDDGSVYLDYTHPLLGDMAIVFGQDQRAVIDIITGEASWWFCFTLSFGYNERGMLRPIVKDGYFVPPDTSS